MENLINNTNLSSNLPLVLKMRCPQCLKLYSADPQEITGNCPKFQCQNCTTKFWISYPESLGQGEVLGYSLQETSPDDSLSYPAKKPTPSSRFNRKPSTSSTPFNPSTPTQTQRSFRALTTKSSEEHGRVNPLKTNPTEVGLPKKGQGAKRHTQTQKKDIVIKPKRMGRFPTKVLAFIGLLCIVLIGAGIMVPDLRNLVGIGVAGLFLSVAIHRFLISNG